MIKLKNKLLLVPLAILLISSLLASSGCLVYHIASSALEDNQASITATTTATTTAATITQTATATTLPATVTTTPTWTAPATGAAGPTMADFASVVAMVRPSVVAITTEVIGYDYFNQPVAQEGAGSGWVIDSAGLIVTNNHVIEGASSIIVTLADGSDLPAVLVGGDAMSDLAVLKVDQGGLPAISVGNSAQVQVGEWALAIGNALGEGISATEGIISRKGVNITISEGEVVYDLIQTSAAINPGNSGGPLVNMAGEIIGITSIKLAEVGVEAMGYAIATDTAIPIIEQLIQQGYVTRPWMGVSLYTVDANLARRYELPLDYGVLLTQVGAGSPAELAGLAAGDVVTHLDGQAVDTIEEFRYILLRARVGQQLSVTYWRDNSGEQTAYVVLSASPNPV